MIRIIQYMLDFAFSIAWIFLNIMLASIVFLCAATLSISIIFYIVYIIETGIEYIYPIISEIP